MDAVSLKKTNISLFICGFQCDAAAAAAAAAAARLITTTAAAPEGVISTLVELLIPSVPGISAMIVCCLHMPVIQ